MSINTLRQYINETRRLNNPNVEYEEIKKKDVLDRVIATLAKSESAKVTKLAKTYKEIQDLQNQLKVLQNEQNKYIKEVSQTFFDVADSVVTKVIQTASYVITFSRQTKTPAQEKEIIDYEKIVNELNELLPEHAKTIEMLIDKYKEIKQIPEKETPLKLTSVEIRDKRVHESIEDQLEENLSRFVSLIYNRIRLVNKKIDAII